MVYNDDFGFTKLKRWFVMMILDSQNLKDGLQ